MTIFLKSDKIGEGVLGNAITIKFIESLNLNAKEDKNLIPNHIIFVNRGVLLCTDNSDNTDENKIENAIIIPYLKELESLGSKIICCGTCIEFFGLQYKLLVGNIGNSKYIARALATDKVVSL